MSNNPQFRLKVIVSIGFATALGLAALMALQQSTAPARAEETYKSDAPRRKDIVAELGKDLFFDTNLSNPVGQSCGSCHAPDAGFTYPESKDNKERGIADGAVEGRFGFRSVPTVAYAAYIPTGLPTYDPALTAFAGGLFWDGRSTDLTNQAHFPLENPNEMNNIVHNQVDTDLIARKVAEGEYAGLFKEVYGNDVFDHSSKVVLSHIATAIAHYEKSPEVSPFSSKYDAWRAGKAELSKSEMDGLRLVTGSTTGRPGGPANYKAAQCILCHSIPADPSSGPDLWTNTCYANIGVPRNPDNPYYKQTNAKSDPLGFNPLGEKFVDLGLGDFLYPHLGLPSGNMGQGSNGQGDYLAINGTFKAPTLRNVDRRPKNHFVKAYFHNGSFKDLKDVVHFYNTRNLTTEPGEVIDFTQPDPYAGLQGKPLWPEPEFPSAVTLQNPTGDLGSPNAQVGNLGLTDDEEDDIVSFLKTLSDGYFDPD